MAACPQCSAGLVRVGDGPPWCPSCEWNLGAFPRATASRVERVSHRIAFGMNRSLFTELAAGPQPRPHWTLARAFLVAVSIVLALATIAGFAGGIALMFGHQFGLRVLGFFLALVAIELRPRLPRWRIETGLVPRAEAPELFALLDEVADRLHAPRIVTLAVDERWNATCGRRGLRRQPTLVLGMPLWAALSPPGRVALLGHEIGHLVNSDPTRGLLAEPALSTFGRLSDLFDPRQMVRYAGTSDLDDIRIYGSRGHGLRLVVFGWLATLLSLVLFTPIWWTARWIQAGLRIVASRDHQHAEIYADAIAVSLGGSDGAAELLDSLLFSDRVQTAVARSARRGDPPEQWRECAAAERSAAAPSRTVQEQYSLRTEASLFARHPPHGMRCRLVERWPSTGPTELVEPARWSAIDASFARQYQRARHAFTIS